MLERAGHSQSDCQNTQKNLRGKDARKEFVVSSSSRQGGIHSPMGKTILYFISLSVCCPKLVDESLCSLQVFILWPFVSLPYTCECSDCSLSPTERIFAFKHSQSFWLDELLMKLLFRCDDNLIQYMITELSDLCCN